MPAVAPRPAAIMVDHTSAFSPAIAKVPQRAPPAAAAAPAVQIACGMPRVARARLNSVTAASAAAKQRIAAKASRPQPGSETMGERIGAMDVLEIFRIGAPR